jgi:hypothetical protein
MHGRKNVIATAKPCSSSGSILLPNWQRFKLDYPQSVPGLSPTVFGTKHDFSSVKRGRQRQWKLTLQHLQFILDGKYSRRVVANLVRRCVLLFSCPVTASRHKSLPARRTLGFGGAISELIVVGSGPDFVRRMYN